MSVHCESWWSPMFTIRLPRLLVVHWSPIASCGVHYGTTGRTQLIPTILPVTFYLVVSHWCPMASSGVFYAIPRTTWETTFACSVQGVAEELGRPRVAQRLWQGCGKGTSYCL